MNTGSGLTNINNGISSASLGRGQIQPYLPSKSFRNDIFTTAPKKVKPVTVNNNVVNLYSPKLLLKTYCNKDYVQKIINENPKIQQILNANGIEAQIHPENVLNIQNSHLQTTGIIAQQIANQMGISQAEKQILDQACVFHDFGKILIPQEILNKPGTLTDNEKDIMSLHSELGYELLSSSGLNKRTLDLVKNHHDPRNSADVLCQILSVADIYSALREQRSYKQPLSNAKALEILDQKAQNGEVSTEVVNALRRIVVNAA